MFMLTIKMLDNTITEKERDIRKALDADTDITAFWRHIIWLFEHFDENREIVKEAMKTLASSNSEAWAEDVLNIALRHRNAQEEPTQPPKPEEGKPLVWD